MVTVYTSDEYEDQSSSESDAREFSHIENVSTPSEVNTNADEEGKTAESLGAV